MSTLVQGIRIIVRDFKVIIWNKNVSKNGIDSKSAVEAQGSDRHIA